MRTLKLFIITACLSIAFFGCQRDEDIVNQVPVANAGPSQNITLPATLTLSGSGTDADGQIVAYLWSQVNGPSPAVFANPGAATTTVSNIVAGNYLFQLMVTDNDGATGVDTISVKVNAAPEVTLSVQPANNPNEFVLALSGSSNDGSSNGWVDIPLAQWTNGGVPVTIRSLLKFDLSSIPQSAVIVSANLYLYSCPPPYLDGNGTDANAGSNNTVIVQRAVSSWSPTTTNWFNQPAGATQGQIIVPHTNAGMLDLNLDVTGQVSTMVNTNANYGFLLKLQSEVLYTSRIFASSHNPAHAGKYPKLVVVYH